MSELQYIKTSLIHPHPDNPRKNLGDLTELVDSIKVTGILQNLTVVPRDDGEYTVIIGHRRHAAGQKAGLDEMPCIVREMPPQEQVRTMLMENIQRSDLTVYEQAQGFQLMLDMGETVESIARDSGFSQTTVRRRVKLLELDAEKFRKSEGRGATLQDYLELDKIDDPELKDKALDAIGTSNFRDVLKKAIEDDKNKKRMAQWEADLEAFATKIEKRGYVGGVETPMEYITNFGRWSQKDKMVEKPKDAGKVKYYYIVGEFQIDLYCDRQERAEREETEEERQRREEMVQHERNKAELEEITERHFSLRSEFISNFSAVKKNALAIMRFAAGVIIGDGEYGRDDINTKVLAELLDLDIDDDTEYPEIISMVEQRIAEMPEYTLLACAYASVDEDYNKYWRWRWYDGGYHCCYEPNDDLDRLYDFLISLGYEMSDEEKAMQNGSHELLEQATQ